MLAPPPWKAKAAGRTSWSNMPALVANGAAQKNLEAAANELEEAINQGNLNHSETATGHVETAISYLKEANK